MRKCRGKYWPGCVLLMQSNRTPECGCLNYTVIELSCISREACESVMRSWVSSVTWPWLGVRSVSFILLAFLYGPKMAAAAPSMSLRTKVAKVEGKEAGKRVTSWELSLSFESGRRPPASLSRLLWKAPVRIRACDHCYPVSSKGYGVATGGFAQSWFISRGWARYHSKRIVVLRGRNTRNVLGSNGWCQAGAVECCYPKGGRRQSSTDLPQSL